MTLKTSQRSDIQTFRALENLRAVNEKIAGGADIIRLEAGQPCFGAPQTALDYAAQCLIDNPVQGYTDALGMLPLRQRIADYYLDYYGITISPEQISITAGSSPGFIMSFLSAFDAGDKIALCTPPMRPIRISSNPWIWILLKSRPMRRPISSPRWSS